LRWFRNCCVVCGHDQIGYLFLGEMPAMDINRNDVAHRIVAGINLDLPRLKLDPGKL